MFVFDDKDTGEEFELDPVLEDEGFQDDEDLDDESFGQDVSNDEQEEGETSETKEGEETAEVKKADKGSDDDKGEAHTEDTDDKNAKKPLSKEENAANARRRREEQLNAKLREARVNTIIEVLGGKNPFTGKDMTDAHDVEVYERMKRIQKSGGDPIADYATTLAEEQRQAERSSREAANAKEDFNSWAQKDGLNFAKAHPDVNVSKLFQDDTFKTIAEPLLERQVPMTEIYKIYQSTQSNIDSVKQRAKKQLKDEVASNIANERASAGALKAKGDNEGALYTREQLAAMSQEELEANWDKVERSYDALR